jgi:uncharacterized protein (DUF1800 family)
MALELKNVPVSTAWLPLDPKAWNAEHARHLLRRMGFAATPDGVAHSVKIGLAATLQEAFGQVRPMPQPDSLTAYRAQRDLVTRQAAGPGRTQLYMDLERLRREAFNDSVHDWLVFARKPENSAQENFTLFLSDVLVVAFNKDKEPARIFDHVALLRRSWQMTYPELVKAVTFSPAMIQYLDLNSSYVGVPNENYARELMELFTLGEGHYNETDVKEAARALTGIVIRNEQGVLARPRWDPGSKTIFGNAGHWGANDVVDLIFQQPAARTFLPREFLAWYLTNDPLPKPYVDALGALWAERGLRLGALPEIVFSSRLFYDPQFQGTLIKSPVRYYLGLLQDLNLDVSPLQGQVTQTFRAMAQEPFNAPNVRGWVGGKNWINSSTLAARRQLVQQLFGPANPNQLTADQRMMLATAAKAGRGNVTVTPDRLQNVATMSAPELADHFLNYFLPGTPDPAYRATIIDYLLNDQGQPTQLVREVAESLLQSPLYNVC